MSRPLTASRIALRQTYQDSVHVSAVYQNVIISHSLAEPTVGYMADWVKTIRELAKDQRGVGSIIIIDSTAKPPSEAIRGDIKNAIALAGTHLKGLAQVVEGTGFGAAAKRSALSLISLVARFPFPVKICSTRREAAVWMKEKLADPSLGSAFDALNAEEVIEACDIVARTNGSR